MSASQSELRAAAYAGILRLAETSGRPFSSLEAQRVAGQLYPPKVVTRVREVVGRGGLVYRVAVGELQVSDAVCANRNWRPYFVDEMQRIVADLFANPTETVEVD